MNPTDYIRSQGRGREARDLELQAMNDPLLADALDGFLAVEGDHLGAIDRLQKRIAEASAPHRSGPLRILCGAAAVLLLGAAGLLLVLQPAPSATPSEKLPTLTAATPATQPEETRAEVPQSETATVITQVAPPPVVRPIAPQLPEPAAQPTDTLVIVGFMARQKTAFTGASPRQRPLGEILQEQLQVPPPPLPPGKNLPSGPRPAPHPLAADYPNDPATHESSAFESESEELCDRFDLCEQSTDPHFDDLPDNLYGGGDAVHPMRLIRFKSRFQQ